MHPNDKMRTFEVSILRGPFQAIFMTIKINKTVKLLLTYFFVGGAILLVINIGFGARPTSFKVIKIIIYNGLTFTFFAVVNDRLADYIAQRFPWVEHPTRTFFYCVYWYARNDNACLVSRRLYVVCRCGG